MKMFQKKTQLPLVFHFSQTAPRGFSLVELLCVVAIIGLLATVTLPMISGRSDSLNGGLQVAGGMMERARQYAISQNTYVWVLMAPSSAADDGQMALVASRDGTDAIGWSAATLDLANLPSCELVDRVRVLSRVEGTDTPSVAITSLPDVPTPAKMANVQVKIGNKTFTKAVQFTPTGEARVAVGVDRFIDLAFAPKNVASGDPNQAVIRISGLTGKSTIYRN